MKVRRGDSNLIRSLATVALFLAMPLGSVNAGLSKGNILLNNAQYPNSQISVFITQGHINYRSSTSPNHKSRTPFAHNSIMENLSSEHPANLSTGGRLKGEQHYQADQFYNTNIGWGEHYWTDQRPEVDIGYGIHYKEDLGHHYCVGEMFWESQKTGKTWNALKFTLDDLDSRHWLHKTGEGRHEGYTKNYKTPLTDLWYREPSYKDPYSSFPIDNKIIPEPATGALFSIGVLSLLMKKKRE